MSASSLSPERIHKRLGRVFAKAFPESDNDSDTGGVRSATRDNTPGWDSIGTLALFGFVEEDFGIKLGYDKIAEIQSYEQLFALVEKKLS